MNCKPPFLGQYFRSLRGNDDPDLGKLVRVISVSHDSPLDWEVDTLGQKFYCYEDGFSDGVETIDLPKECVRPFKDPGDDAVDEVIQRLGSPNKQEQKA